jgi:hypothetical protein
VREVSARYLSQDERFQIADLHRGGVSIRQIGDQLGRASSTVSRELRRNATPGGDYRPFQAHHQAVARRPRHHRRRLDTNAELRSVVGELLSQRWSPAQIARHLRVRQPDLRESACRMLSVTGATATWLRLPVLGNSISTGPADGRPSRFGGGAAASALRGRYPTAEPFRLSDVP